MNPEQIVTACTAAGVRLVRFLYCDNGCTIRGKLVPVERLAERMRTGQGLTVAMQAMNMLDQLQTVEGMSAVGEIRLVPDPQSFVLLPYAPHSAAMMCDMITLERAPWGACPRSFLKRQLACAAEHGMSVQAALENEHRDIALSPREKECLLWVAQGLRSKQIADKLGLRPVTVELHLKNARTKLRAATREQAIAIALLNGLISP